MGRLSSSRSEGIIWHLTLLTFFVASLLTFSVAAIAISILKRFVLIIYAHRRNSRWKAILPVFKAVVGLPVDVSMTWNVWEPFGLLLRLYLIPVNIATGS